MLRRFLSWLRWTTRTGWVLDSVDLVRYGSGMTKAETWRYRRTGERRVYYPFTVEK